MIGKIIPIFVKSTQIKVFKIKSNQIMNQEKKVLTKKDVSKRLNASISTVERLIRSGKLKSFKFFDKGKVYVTEDELNKFLNQICEA